MTIAPPELAKTVTIREPASRGGPVEGPPPPPDAPRPLRVDSPIHDCRGASLPATVLYWVVYWVAALAPQGGAGAARMRVSVALGLRLRHLRDAAGLSDRAFEVVLAGLNRGVPWLGVLGAVWAAARVAIEDAAPPP